MRGRNADVKFFCMISYEPSLYGTKGTESDEDDVAVWRLPVHENLIERMYTNEQGTRNKKSFAGQSIVHALSEKTGISRARITARVIILS